MQRDDPSGAGHATAVEHRLSAGVVIVGVMMAITLLALPPLASSGATPEDEKLRRPQSQIERAREKIGANSSVCRGIRPMGDPGLEPGTSSLSEKRSNRLS